MTENFILSETIDFLLRKKNENCVEIMEAVRSFHKNIFASFFKISPVVGVEEK